MVLSRAAGPKVLPVVNHEIDSHTPTSTLRAPYRVSSISRRACRSFFHGLAVGAVDADLRQPCRMPTSLFPSWSGCGVPEVGLGR
jgi:hypothetical protein